MIEKFKKIADVTLERFLLNELTLEQMNALRQRLKKDVKSANRLQELKKSNDEIEK